MVKYIYVVLAYFKKDEHVVSVASYILANNMFDAESFFLKIDENVDKIKKGYMLYDITIKLIPNYIMIESLKSQGFEIR